MRRTNVLIPFLFLLSLLSAPGAHSFAQEDSRDQLQLRLNRDFGFGLAGQMQGTFSYHVSGPDNLIRVLFLLDDEIIGQDDQAPFQLRFNTSDYDLGTHTLRAVGFTADGRELGSNALVRQFVPGRLVIWLVAAAVVLIVGFRVASYLLTRQKGSADEVRPGYGVLGGAVCPNCGRAFGLHWWGIKLMASRIDRCPHCGKWNSVSRASYDELRAAERFADDINGTDVVGSELNVSEEEQLRRRLDDSRYEDGRRER